VRIVVVVVASLTVTWGLCGQVLYSYSIGFVYILTGLLSVGGLGPAVAFCSEVSRAEDKRTRYYANESLLMYSIFILCSWQLRFNVY